MKLRRTSILAAAPIPFDKSYVSSPQPTPSAGDVLLRICNVLSSHLYCLAHKSPGKRLPQENEQTPPASSSLAAPTPYAGEASQRMREFSLSSVSLVVKHTVWPSVDGRNAEQDLVRAERVSPILRLARCGGSGCLPTRGGWSLFMSEQSCSVCA
jgi:hypothetical protein